MIFEKFTIFKYNIIFLLKITREFNFVAKNHRFYLK